MTAGRPLSVARGAISETQEAFYAAVFGWRRDGQTMSLGGSPVAACGLPVSTPGWLTVLASSGLDADLAVLTAAGGSVVERAPEGIAVVQDRSGAALVLHDGETLPGLARAQGHFCWTQLNARDIGEAASFYQALCGWETAEAVNGTFTYQDFSDPGGALAGLMAIDEASGLGVPVMWQVYIDAPDVDEVASRVEAEGGRIWVRPTTIAPGRFAVCADPDGDVFAVEHMA